jgi:hypothetical protein
LLFGSTATVDQRGAPRAFDQGELPNTFDGCDIGAFEMQSEFACTCETDIECTFPETCFAGCVCRYVPFCGSGICDPGEDGVSCAADCPAVCGNGLVEPGEECEAANQCPPCGIGFVRACNACACGCVPFP